MFIKNLYDQLAQFENELSIIEAEAAKLKAKIKLANKTIKQYQRIEAGEIVEEKIPPSSTDGGQSED